MESIQGLPLPLKLECGHITFTVLVQAKVQKDAALNGQGNICKLMVKVTFVG